MTELMNAGAPGGAGEEKEFPVGSWECPDPGGVVRRGRAVSLQEQIEERGPLPCFVAACDQTARMEVYGLFFCATHGEECAAGAMEEIAYDLGEELHRPMNPYVRSPSPHLVAALMRGFGVLSADEAHTDHDRADKLLLEAWPLARDRADAETLAYAEDPDAHGRGHRDPPFDAFQHGRLVLHRHMRLAFEEDASWLVEVLERERQGVAAQAAYALALEREAGLRPAPKAEEASCT